MSDRPVRIVQRHFADLPIQIRSGGDGQPIYAIGSLNPVPVTPVVFCVLHVVVKDENVCIVNEVKVAFPGYIIGLENHDFVHRYYQILRTRGAHVELGYFNNKHFVA